MKRLHSNDPHSARRSRRGVMMIFAMVALLLATVVGAAILQTAMAQRRLTRRQQWRMQSAWLAESGIERADAKLRVDAGYEGETWSISAAEIGGRAKGDVRIAVTADPNDENRRTVRVIANFPAGQADRSQTTKSIEIDLKRPTPSKPE